MFMASFRPIHPAPASIPIPRRVIEGELSPRQERPEIGSPEERAASLERIRSSLPSFNEGLSFERRVDAVVQAILKEARALPVESGKAIFDQIEQLTNEDDLRMLSILQNMAARQ